MSILYCKLIKHTAIVFFLSPHFLCLLLISTFSLSTIRSKSHHQDMFVSLKIIYKKIFFEFLSVCFTKNKWSIKNIFLINEKSNHFSVKCLTDFKSVKYFTKIFFFFVKYFFVSHFQKNIFL